MVGKRVIRRSLGIRTYLETFESRSKILKQIFNVFNSYAHAYESVLDSLFYSSLTRDAGVGHACWVFDE